MFRLHIWAKGSNTHLSSNGQSDRISQHYSKPRCPQGKSFTDATGIELQEDSNAQNQEK